MFSGNKAGRVFGTSHAADSTFSGGAPRRHSAFNKTSPHAFGKSSRGTGHSGTSGLSDTEDDATLVGVVGCVSWQVEITKDRRKNMKFVYLDPLTGKIFQQGENTQKSFYAKNIIEVSYINDESINVTIKMPSDVMPKTRVYTFANARIATEFKTLIEYINEFGSFIILAFKSITREESAPGLITVPILQAAMHTYDINASLEDVHKM